MFVRMAHWHCKPDCHDEALDKFRNGALPILRRQPGFLRAQLLGSAGESARIAYTCWDSEANYRDFAASETLGEITEMFAHMYIDGVPPKAVDWPVLCQGQAS